MLLSTNILVHKLFGSFLPPAPCPLLLLHPPSLAGRICSALISNFVEEKVKAVIRKTK
jgi:hypothetical protein